MLLSFFEVYFSKYCCLLVFLFFTSFFWKKVVVYGFFVGFVSFLQGIIDCFRNYSNYITVGGMSKVFMDVVYVFKSFSYNVDHMLIVQAIVYLFALSAELYQMGSS